MKSQLIQLLTLGIRSFSLDLQLLISHYPHRLSWKLEFIFKKYLLLIKHILLKIPPHAGLSSISIGSKKYFYESIYGISIFQSMITSLNTYIFHHINDMKNPVVLDLGAHVGFASLALTYGLSQPHIYACEPVSLTYKLLVKNVHGISSIEPFHIGFSDKKEKKYIYFSPKLLMYSSLFAKRFNWNKNPKREKISLTTLDAFCKENKIPRIDLLKIDSEGSEEKILCGAKKTLLKTRYLLLECSFDGIGKSTFSSLMRQLMIPGCNFQLITIGQTMKTTKKQLLTADMLFKNLKFKEKNNTA